MKKTATPVLFCLSFLLCASMAFGQIFNYSYTTKEQTYSSQNNMVIDYDGSTVAVSTIREYNFSNEYDAHVIKVDDNGNVIWTRRFGMPGVDERANAICQTDDNGYIITGVKDEPGRGYAMWVFKIDNSGNLQWSEWFGFSNAFISEGFVATRTFEGNETYLIAGSVEYPRRICAVKIDGAGNMIWSQQYYDPALVNSKWDFVTSMTEDYAYDGYIITGTEHDYYTTGFSTLDLFTIGIDLNGNITRPYTKYDLNVGDYEFSPSITRGFEDDGFVISFGTRAGSVQPGTVSLISFMKLDDALNPQWTNLYAPPSAYESNANSVYVDPHGFYDMGVFMYEGGEGGEGGGVRNAAFLRIDPSGNPINFYRYNIDQDQTCTFMAQDFTALHENYVLKTDHVANGTFSVGLIRTELYGESECSHDEPVNVYPVHPTLTEQTYKPFFFAKNKDVVAKQQKDHPVQIHCDDLMFTSQTPNSSHSIAGETIYTDQKISVASSDAAVYPSIVGQDNAALNIHFDATVESTLSIKIYNSLGNQIADFEYEVYSGSNQFTLEKLDLPKGLNTVVIYQDNQWKATEKVIRL